MVVTVVEATSPYPRGLRALEAAEELVRRCFSTSAVAPSRSAFERE